MFEGIGSLAPVGILGTDGAVLLACLALAAAAWVFIFVLEPDASDSAPHRSRLAQLLERRDTIYENLRDLKFEHRAGKYSEKDYEEMKKALETEAALALAEIDTVTSGQRLPTRKGRSSDPSASAPMPQLPS